MNLLHVALVLLAWLGVCVCDPGVRIVANVTVTDPGNCNLSLCSQPSDCNRAFFRDDLSMCVLLNCQNNSSCDQLITQLGTKNRTQEPHPPPSSSTASHTSAPTPAPFSAPPSNGLNSINSNNTIRPTQGGDHQTPSTTLQGGTPGQLQNQTTSPQGGTTGQNQTTSTQGGTKGQNQTTPPQGGPKGQNQTTSPQGGTKGQNQTTSPEGGTKGQNQTTSPQEEGQGPNITQNVSSSNGRNGNLGNSSEVPQERPPAGISTLGPNLPTMTVAPVGGGNTSTATPIGITTTATPTTTIQATPSSSTTPKPSTTPSNAPFLTSAPPSATSRGPNGSQTTPKRVGVPSGADKALVEAAGGELMSQVMNTSSLLAVLMFGLLFFIVTVALFLRHAYESYKRRDYTQVDYLINGMYSDSGL